MITDPIERIVAAALNEANESFRHDAPLDFECDGFSIEVKQFYTPRLDKQIRDRSAVIVIQGEEAAKAFYRLITGREYQPGDNKKEK